MAGIRQNILTALTTRMEAFSFDATKIAWPNKPFTPPADGSTFLEVKLFSNTSEELFLAPAAQAWHRGFMQVLIRAPLNGSAYDAAALADQIVAHFPSGLKLRSESVAVHIYKAPDVMSGMPTEVSWDVPVTIPYETFA